MGYDETRQGNAGSNEKNANNAVEKAKARAKDIPRPEFDLDDVFNIPSSLTVLPDNVALYANQGARATIPAFNGKASGHNISAF